MKVKTAISKIQKQYKKLLTSYSKYFFIENNSINYFITYLRYLRDVAILSTENKNLKTDTNILTLCFAIEEYDNMKSCINKYYKPNGAFTDQFSKNFRKEDILKAYQAEQLTHTENFYNTVKNNINNWIEAYGN